MPCSAATKCIESKVISILFFPGFSDDKYCFFSFVAESFCTLSGQVSKKKLDIPNSMRLFLGVPLIVSQKQCLKFLEKVSFFEVISTAKMHQIDQIIFHFKIGLFWIIFIHCAPASSYTLYQLSYLLTAMS